MKEEGRIVAASGTNERDLSLERDVSGANERVAMYPVEKLPKAEDKETVPLDRRAGLGDTRRAEEELAALKEEVSAPIR